MVKMGEIGEIGETQNGKYGKNRQNLKWQKYLSWDNFICLIEHTKILFIW